MDVALIGLGAMGGALAERLTTAGVAPMVHDLDQQRVDRLVGLGARRLPDDAAPDILITSLPADEHVDAVLDDARLASMRGGLVVEMSTTKPGTVQRLAEGAAAYSVGVVDAPVSGGPMDALAGELVVMAGGSASDIERARPVLERLGSVTRVGEVGQAKLIKLINNVMAAGNLAVAAEVFSLGTSMGLEPHALLEVLERSGGASRTLSKRFPWALEDDFTARFPLRLAEKDARLALSVAAEAGFELPLADRIHATYATAVDAGLGDQDMVAVLKVSGLEKTK